MTDTLSRGRYAPACVGARVPTCALDAARIKGGEKPEIREVEIGGRRVPYFEAGATFAPYGEGYLLGALTTLALPGTARHRWGARRLELVRRRRLRPRWRRVARVT